jgi:hypothetical protein
VALEMTTLALDVTQLYDEVSECLAGLLDLEDHDKLTDEDLAAVGAAIDLYTEWNDLILTIAESAAKLRSLGYPARPRVAVTVSVMHNFERERRQNAAALGVFYVAADAADDDAAGRG